MKLSGSYKLQVKKEIVWRALNDPSILKQCIPGCDTFEKLNENTFEATATNQIGPMNATFSGTITVLLSGIAKKSANAPCLGGIEINCRSEQILFRPLLHAKHLSHETNGLTVTLLPLFCPFTIIPAAS